MFTLTVLAVLACLIINCNKTNPLSSDPQEEKTESIPWSKITGRIAYSYNYKLYIIDGNVQEWKQIASCDSEEWFRMYSDVTWKANGSHQGILLYAVIAQFDEKRGYSC